MFERRSIDLLVQAKCKMAIVVSPTADCFQGMQRLVDGSIVMNDANVNAGAIVGNNVSSEFRLPSGA
jgi:hypothetical protein